MRQGVAGAFGFDGGVEGAAQECEVADEVEEFVLGGLVIHAPLVVDGVAVIADDEHVAGREVFEEAGLLRGPCFVFE